MHHLVRLAAAILCVSMVGAGCASSYTVPGGPASMAMLEASDRTLPGTGVERVGPAVSADPVPMAKFPTMIAVARVQAAGYESRTARGYGGGGLFSVVTTRDVESDDAINRVAKMPGVVGLAPINRLLLPGGALSEAGLREAARRVNADMLVFYTFDSQFYVKDFAKPVTVFTLGLSPNRRAYVNTTATALITDARTGYVYGGAETTEKSDQLSNGWTSEDAVDDTRRRTETRAFDKLVGEIEKTWPTIAAQYGHPAPATAPADR